MDAIRAEGSLCARLRPLLRAALRRCAEAAAAQCRTCAAGRSLADESRGRIAGRRNAEVAGAFDAAQRTDALLARRARARCGHPHLADLLAVIGHRAAESRARTRDSYCRGDH